ncbi:MAG: sigma-70 family RNA polymerase sigma factor [Lachnospiraceae bacterium]|nr:sigma-70 family RNA polymerase sigma factor [Lachnospiraceae bacterium]
MDDRELLQLLRDDPETGTEALIRTYGKAVHKICSSVLSGRGREITEEAAADTFVRLWRYRDKIRPDETHPLKSYVYTVARNTARDRLRKEPDVLSLEQACEDGFEPESDEDTERDFLRRWLADQVHASVDELGEPDRSIFLERYFLGRSVKAIAAHLNLPEKKVENVLCRGKKRLRSILARKGVTSYE